MSTDRQSVTMKTEKFRTIHEAMSGIAAKMLPPDSEVKLSLLVGSYQLMYDKTTVVLKKVEEKYSRMIGRERILTQEGAVRRDRILATPITVRLPVKSLLITRADLPVKSDDADDAKNRQAVALLVGALGPFYDHGSKDETKAMLDTDLDADSLAALEAAGDAAEPAAEPPAPIAEVSE
jgi:hypothetical protein